MVTYAIDGDSYIDLPFADDYHDKRNRSDWADLSDPEKKAALVHATSFLDHAYSWKGDITEESQDHAWPRSDVEDQEGRELDKDTIPERIKRAAAELAYIEALEQELMPTSEPGTVTSIEAGPVSLDFDKSNGSGPTKERINTLLRGLYLRSASSNSQRVVRS